MTQIVIEINEQPFTAQDLIASCPPALLQAENCGAEVTFIGRVRAYGDTADVIALQLEHYPAMTYRQLQMRCELAGGRFGVQAIVLRHRVGRIGLGEAVVGILVLSAHRQAAFDAVQYLMDFLKHEAPFWKQELTVNGAKWVDQKQSDQKQLARWC